MADGQLPLDLGRVASDLRKLQTRVDDFRAHAAADRPDESVAILQELRSQAQSAVAQLGGGAPDDVKLWARGIERHAAKAVEAVQRGDLDELKTRLEQISSNADYAANGVSSIIPPAADGRGHWTPSGWIREGSTEPAPPVPPTSARPPHYQQTQDLEPLEFLSFPTSHLVPRGEYPPVPEASSSPHPGGGAAGAGSDLGRSGLGGDAGAPAADAPSPAPPPPGATAAPPSPASSPMPRTGDGAMAPTTGTDGMQHELLPDVASVQPAEDPLAGAAPDAPTLASPPDALTEATEEWTLDPAIEPATGLDPPPGEEIT